MRACTIPARAHAASGRRLAQGLVGHGLATLEASLRSKPTSLVFIVAPLPCVRDCAGMRRRRRWMASALAGLQPRARAHFWRGIDTVSEPCGSRSSADFSGVAAPRRAADFFRSPCGLGPVVDTRSTAADSSARPPIRLSLRRWSTGVASTRCVHAVGVRGRACGRCEPGSEHAIEGHRSLGSSA